jgi:hypothetical protein
MRRRAAQAGYRDFRADKASECGMVVFFRSQRGVDCFTVADEHEKHDARIYFVAERIAYESRNDNWAAVERTS